MAERSQNYCLTPWGARSRRPVYPVLDMNKMLGGKSLYDVICQKHQIKDAVIIGAFSHIDKTSIKDKESPVPISTYVLYGIDATSYANWKIIFFKTYTDHGVFKYDSFNVAGGSALIRHLGVSASITYISYTYILTFKGIDAPPAFVWCHRGENYWMSGRFKQKGGTWDNLSSPRHVFLVPYGQATVMIWALSADGKLRVTQPLSEEDFATEDKVKALLDDAGTSIKMLPLFCSDGSLPSSAIAQYGDKILAFSRTDAIIVAQLYTPDPKDQTKSLWQPIWTPAPWKKGALCQAAVENAWNELFVCSGDGEIYGIGKILQTNDIHMASSSMRWGIIEAFPEFIASTNRFCELQYDSQDDVLLVNLQCYHLTTGEQPEERLAQKLYGYCGPLDNGQKSPWTIMGFLDSDENSPSERIFPLSDGYLISSDGVASKHILYASSKHNIVQFVKDDTLPHSWDCTYQTSKIYNQANSRYAYRSAYLYVQYPDKSEKFKAACRVICERESTYKDFEYERGAVLGEMALGLARFPINTPGCAIELGCIGNYLEFEITVKGKDAPPHLLQAAIAYGKPCGSDIFGVGEYIN